MQNKIKSIIRARLRPVLTVLSIGFFLLIALATDVNSFLDTSTNTTVVIKNCQAKPEVPGKLVVTATAVDTLGNPINYARGKLFIVHQKVRYDSCLFDVVFSLNQDFSTGTTGTYAYTGPDWIHDNSQDLWRVEIEWGESLFGHFPQPRKVVKVQYYNTSEFNFTGVQKTKL